jgi:hypothetical protein
LQEYQLADLVLHALLYACCLQLSKWFTWLVLPAFLFTGVFWVTRLNKVSKYHNSCTPGSQFHLKEQKQHKQQISCRRLTMQQAQHQQPMVLCQSVVKPMVHVGGAAQGLKMFPAMVIVPTLQICWTLFSILSGMLYFQEYQEMGALAAAMFCLGVTVSETLNHIILHHITLHYITLHYITSHYITLHHITLHYKTGAAIFCLGVAVSEAAAVSVSLLAAALCQWQLNARIDSTGCSRSSFRNALPVLAALFQLI